MVWTPDKFQHAKGVHVVQGKVLGNSVVIETVDVLIDLSHLAVNGDDFSCVVTAYSRFTERIALAAADPGGQRPREQA